MNKIIKMFAIILASLLLFTACNTTVNNDKKEETTEQTEEKKEQTEEAKTEEKTDTAEATESEEEAWKKEPFYDKPVQIGYNGGLCTGGAGIAKVLGLFDKEGVKVEIVNIQSKTDAIGTNKVQLTTDHIATLLVPAVNGIDMTFKAGAQTGCKSLYVLNNNEINSTADLKGKAIGLPDGIGNSDHNIALRFMNHDNIDPKEITWKPVESSASILALENGEIAGVVLSDQFAEKFVNDNKIKMIRSLTFDDDFKQEPCCVYAFNKTFEKENPITAKKMTKALFEASDYIQNDIEGATQILFDNNWASGDFDQAVRMMKSYNWQVTNDMAGTALKNILDDYKKFGVITSDKSTDELLTEVWHPEDYKHDIK